MPASINFRLQKMCSHSDKVSEFFVEGLYLGLNNLNHDNLTLNLREINSSSSRGRTCMFSLEGHVTFLS